MPEQQKPPSTSDAADVAAAEMEALRYLSTRFRKPFDIPVARCSSLALPGDAKPPLEVGSWRVETFGSMVELGRRIVRKELMLNQPLAITLFLRLTEDLGLTEPGDVSGGAVPTGNRLKTN